MSENKELWEFALPDRFKKPLKDIAKVVDKLCEGSNDKFRALDVCKDFLTDEIKKLKLRNTLV